jgi:hypothetical protein
VGEEIGAEVVHGVRRRRRPAQQQQGDSDDERFQLVFLAA